MELKTQIAECTAYDFKVMLEEKKPKSWLKSVSAFANGLGGSLFLGIYNEDTIFASTDTPNVGDHVGDVPETKLTERQQKKLKLIKESPTVTGKQMSETLIADVTALVNIILGKDNEEPYEYNHKAADVNDDKAISVADVTALVNKILGR